MKAIKGSGSPHVSKLCLGKLGRVACKNLFIEQMLSYAAVEFHGDNDCRNI